jgi:hypothetical protein
MIDDVDGCDFFTRVTKGEQNARKCADHYSQQGNIINHRLA